MTVTTYGGPHLGSSCLVGGLHAGTVLKVAARWGAADLPLR